MSFYNGNLFNYIEKHENQLSCEEVINISCQILQALNVLHARRIIHRDVKSTNIFYDQSDPPVFVLGDFGESKVLKFTGRTYTLTGSKHWMAPEILLSDGTSPYTVAVDVWSFGMVLYELMTRQYPYHEIKGFGAEKRIMEGKKPEMSGEQMFFYRKIMPIWQECLTFDPDERPSASKILARFEQIKSEIN